MAAVGCGRATGYPHRSADWFQEEFMLRYLIAELLLLWHLLSSAKISFRDEVSYLGKVLVHCCYSLVSEKRGYSIKQKWENTSRFFLFKDIFSKKKKYCYINSSKFRHWCCGMLAIQSCCVVVLPGSCRQAVPVGWPAAAILSAVCAASIAGLTSVSSSPFKWRAPDGFLICQAVGLPI